MQNSNSGLGPNLALNASCKLAQHSLLGLDSLIKATSAEVAAALTLFQVYNRDSQLMGPDTSQLEQSDFPLKVVFLEAGIRKTGHAQRYRSHLLESRGQLAR